MKISFTQKNTIHRGQSVIEMLVAISIFTIAVATIIYLVLDAETGSRKDVARTQALLTAQEGIEAVRSLRDSSFSNLANGTYGLSFTNGKWNLQPAPDTTDDGVTRTVTISNVSTGSGTGSNIGSIDGGNPANGGTIKVCNIIIDAYKNQNTGLGYADSFRVTLFKPNGQSWTVTFTPPLLATEDVLSDAPGLDTGCTQSINLPYGQYSYNAQIITNGGSNWQTVTYNDQYTEAISTVNDFFTYGSNLDSNGLIDITSGRKDRALVLLNKLTPAATAAGDSRTVKQVVSTATWNASPGDTQSVQLTEYFSNWNRRDIDRLTVDMSGARIASGTSNRGIRGVMLSNLTGKSITLDRMILTWNKPSSSLSRITINGTQVYSGTATSGTNLNITNVVLSPGTFNVEINPMLWTQSMTGVPVTMTLIMLDGSSKSFSIPAL